MPHIQKQNPVTKVFQCPHCGAENEMAVTAIIDGEWREAVEFDCFCWYCHKRFYKLLNKGSS
jgi:transcription elongation factor Elf1